MPLARASSAEVPGTPDDHRTIGIIQRTPNRAQINKLLLEFASQNPNHDVTLTGFARAVREWAAKMQLEQQAQFNQGGKYIQTTDGLTPNITQTPGKRLAPTDNAENLETIVSPAKRMRIDESEIVHHPIGDYNVTTPPRRISIFSGSQKVGFRTPLFSPRTRGFTAVNHPRSRVDDSGLLGRSINTAADVDRGQNLDSAVQEASSMCRHKDSPSVLMSSPMPRQLGNDIPTFSSAPSTTQRKPAPSRLNLEIPGAAPPTFINKATHYVAFPAFRKDPKINIEKLQQYIDEAHARNPGMEHTILLKTPIYNLEPDDMRDSEKFAPFVMRPIPKTPASALASSFGTKFTLATPATAEFSAAARMRNMAAARRAQFNIVKQIGTAAATGEPAAYQQKRRLRRTDRILGALNNGHGSSKAAQRKVSHGHTQSAKPSSASEKDKYRTPFDLISALSCIPELATGVAVYLPPRDVLTLYSVSVRFHMQINTYLKSSIMLWTREWAPHAAEVYSWEHRPMYKHLSIPDPAGRPLTVLSIPRASESTSKNPWQRDLDRMVPSIRWYQMVALRDDIAIDILAHLARQGFRCPKGTKVALLKMWMIMDLPTNAERKALLAGPGTFSDQDLLNIVILLTKLAFRLNDPIYGPESADLLELMLGQKSLYSLWQMLFGHDFRDYVSLIQCKIRYDLGWNWDLGCNHISRMLNLSYLQPGASPILGVPWDQIGRKHLEHWGEKGTIVPALLRPSECVMAEAALRKLKIEDHLMALVIWGHVEHSTGRNLVPTEEEIWMRNSEYKNRAIDTSVEFTVFHCRKAKWYELDARGRKKIVLAQEVREEAVNKWDEFKYNDPNLNAESNLELNEQMREMWQAVVGTDQQDLNLRVDADGNEIPCGAPRSATIMTGMVTAGFQQAKEYECDDGYESDSTVDSLEATMAVNDDSKVQFAWKPEVEDHDIHTLRTTSTAPLALDQSQDVDGIYNVSDDEGTILEVYSDEEHVDGDVPFRDEDEIEYENIWDMWEEMDSKVFKALFNGEPDDM